jgi:hypothetical protein
MPQRHEDHKEKIADNPITIKSFFVLASNVQTGLQFLPGDNRNRSLAQDLL